MGLAPVGNFLSGYPRILDVADLFGVVSGVGRGLARAVGPAFFVSWRWTFVVRWILFRACMEATTTVYVGCWGISVSD